MFSLTLADGDNNNERRQRNRRQAERVKMESSKVGVKYISPTGLALVQAYRSPMALLFEEVDDLNNKPNTTPVIYSLPAG